MVQSGVHHLIYSREGIDIFWTCLIEVGEINVDLPFSIHFLCLDHIRNPIWIGGLPDEASIEQLVNLFSYFLLAFRCKATFLLLNGSSLEVHFQLVHHHHWVDA